MSEAKTVPVGAFNAKQYVVNNLKGKHEVAEKIAMVDEMIVRLIDAAETDAAETDAAQTDAAQTETNSAAAKGMSTFIGRLRERYKRTILKENESLKPDSNMTSFSVNKGEMIVFCVRNPSDPYTLIDDNTLKYVAIHEISHIACPETGHTPLFRDIYQYLVRLAIKQRLYVYENYAANPKNYCGIVIRQSVVDS